MAPAKNRKSFCQLSLFRCPSLVPKGRSTIFFSAECPDTVPPVPGSHIIAFGFWDQPPTGIGTYRSCCYPCQSRWIFAPRLRIEFADHSNCLYSSRADSVSENPWLWRPGNKTSFPIPARDRCSTTRRIPSQKAPRFFPAYIRWSFLGLKLVSKSSQAIDYRHSYNGIGCQVFQLFINLIFSALGPDCNNRNANAVPMENRSRHNPFPRLFVTNVRWSPDQSHCFSIPARNR